MKNRTLITLVVLSLATSAFAGDWTRFRGPNGSGISPDSQPVPVTWSPTENLKWKAALPGAGVSSPIVVRDRIFVTCYSGYGVDRNDLGRMDDLKRHLVCVDCVSGKVLWDKTVQAVMPEDSFSGMGIPAHGYASHSPVSDGERVYVFFGKTGALAFDMDGKQLWQTGVGTESDRRRWGSASSPILYDDLLIVTASSESEAIVGLDTATGKEVWRQEASGLANVWGTPLLVDVGDDRTDVVLGVPYEIWGFNPTTGKLRWYSEAMAGDQFNSSVVAAGQTVYAVEGRGGGSIAVRAGGKGDVSKSHTVWTGRDSSRFGTPVVLDGRMYYFSGTVANCIDTETGDRIYQGRLTGGSSGSRDVDCGGDSGGRFRGFGGPGRGGSDYSSPVIAGGKVYYVQASGDTFVFKASAEFEQLSVNRVTADRETFAATPAISNGQIFLRSNKHLYCVAESTAD